MSRIILPYRNSQQGRILVPGSFTSAVPTEVRIPNPEIPPQLQKDLEANAELEPLFRQAVGQALSASLLDPETRPRQLTEQLLKERAEVCFRVLLVMRYDMNFALRRCFDILPDEFVNALKAGVRVEDMVERSQKGMWWKRHGAEEEQMKVAPPLKTNPADLPEKPREDVERADEEGKRIYQEVHGESPDKPF